MKGRVPNCREEEEEEERRLRRKVFPSRFVLRALLDFLHFSPNSLSLGIYTTDSEYTDGINPTELLVCP